MYDTKARKTVARVGYAPGNNEGVVNRARRRRRQGVDFHSNAQFSMILEPGFAFNGPANAGKPVKQIVEESPDLEENVSFDCDMRLCSCHGWRRDCEPELVESDLITRNRSLTRGVSNSEAACGVNSPSSLLVK